MNEEEIYPAPTFWQKNARKTAIALGPLLIAQGRSVRAQIPRMPHAPEPWDGSLPGEGEISILGFGDSTIAGVGVGDARLGLTARFAQALNSELSSGVSWRAVGRSGATTEDLLGPFLPAALENPANIVLVSIGANDAKNLKPLKPTIERFKRLLDVLRDGHPEATLLFSSLPAFFRFTTLPEPLRSVMYAHAQAIERSVRPIIEERPYAFMAPPPPPYHNTFFAMDGFHPSEDGYRDWAHFALRHALERGALEHLKRR
jgi:lysophospholipase L1-like esterase